MYHGMARCGAKERQITIVSSCFIRIAPVHYSILQLIGSHKERKLVNFDQQLAYLLYHRQMDCSRAPRPFQAFSGRVTNVYHVLRTFGMDQQKKIEAYLICRSSADHEQTATRTRTGNRYEHLQKDSKAPATQQPHIATEEPHWFCLVDISKWKDTIHKIIQSQAFLSSATHLQIDLFRKALHYFLKGCFSGLSDFSAFQQKNCPADI